MAWRRRCGALAAASLVAALLTACAGAAGQPGATPGVRTDGPVRLEGSAGRAIDLLPTVWHVLDADGADPGTHLLATAGGLEVLQPRGFVLLGWATQGDAMVSQVTGWSEALGTERKPVVPWLTSAAWFRRTDSGWVLLDRRGHRLARLRDDGPAPTSSTTITTPQPIRADDRARTADAVAGPGARTTSLRSITGRWTAAGLDPRHARLTVTRSGRWEVEGGCASGTGQDLGGEGVLRLLPHGLLLLTDGPVAGVGCSAPAHRPPADAAALTGFYDARSLVLQGDRLTLFDRAGTRIGTLTRAG